jgi:hypothetical protein
MRKEMEELLSRGDDLVEALAPGPLASGQSPAIDSREARDYLFLAEAYVAAHAYGKALEFVAAGLVVDPGHAALIAARGDAKDGLGDEDGALADWQLARELRAPDGATSA